MKPQRVLAIGAHPFDVEVLCGGTLLRFKDAGAAISIAVLTDGAGGNAKMPMAREALAKQRRVHAQLAAGRLGAALHWLGIQDGLLFRGAELRLRLIDVIREARPGVAFIHRLDDFHPDNREAGHIAAEACVLAPLANLRTAHPPAQAVPVMYEMDSWIPLPREGSDYVEIAGVLQRKQQLVARNKLGVNWLKKFDGISIFELVADNARGRGFESGTKYAESFKLSARNIISRTTRVLP